MASESEKIEEVKKYIEATIAEIDSHTENMEKLFKMDKWSRDRELYEIIINSYERHRNTLKRIQKMVEGGKVESGLYTLSTKSEIDITCVETDDERSHGRIGPHTAETTTGKAFGGRHETGIKIGKLGHQEPDTAGQEFLSGCPSGSLSSSRRASKSFASRKFL